MSPSTLQLVLEYDGARFVGWQVQREGRSVQGVLQGAIEKLCSVQPGSVRVTGAGRTDSGVHARGQVASLTAPRELPLKAWMAGLNALLPEDLACVRARVAPDGFDARRHARGKRYVYSIHNADIRTPLLRGRAWSVRRPLDLAAMRAALPGLLGKLDFAALRAADCSANTTVREVRSLQLKQEGALIALSLEATAFLKHMVRNIVGTLVEVGHGKREPASIAALLASRDRNQAGPTAPPHGLLLDEVFYLPGLTDPRAPAAVAESEQSEDDE